MLRLHPRGFAFAEPADATTVPAAPTGLRTGSFYVGRHLLDGLVDADIVAVTASLDGSDAAVSLRLLARQRRHLIGTVTEPALVVLDPGVSTATVRLERPVVVGTCVELTIDDTAAVTDIELLGPALDPDVVAHRMLRRFRLPVTDVAASASTIGQSEPALLRRDLRDQFVITIDADHSEDLDDALAAEAGPDGSIRVFVHIADVAQVVERTSAVDTAAAATPTSIYLPGRTRHMLPRTLAAEALSLLPGTDRNVLTVELRIDPEGQVRSVDLYPSLIRSAARLSYVSVAADLTGNDNDDATALTDTQAALVALLHAAAVRLGQVRTARGGVDAYRGDLHRGDDGRDDIAHQLVERLMVATNEAVARWLAERGAPVLYRIHPAPSARDAATITDVLGSVGIYAPLPDPLTPAAFAAVAALATSCGQAPLFWDAAMAALPRAVYRTTPGEHFGLGSPAYLHFTSPLRRYADLCVHRVVRRYLAGVRGTETAERAELDAVTGTVNVVAAAADGAERAMRTTLALAGLAVGEVFDAVVLSSDTRTRVALVGVPDVVATLTNAGNTTVGQRLKVKVTALEPFAGRCDTVTVR